MRRHWCGEPIAQRGGAEHLRRTLRVPLPHGNGGDPFQVAGDVQVVVNAVRQVKTRPEERCSTRVGPADQRQHRQAIARLCRGTVVPEVMQQLPGLLRVFLNAVQPGAADRAYGMQVARLAGLPSWVADHAGALLADATRETAAERAVAKDRAMGQECAVAPPPTPDSTSAEQ